MTGPRIILATAGSLGDLHPFLAVGQALLARGARPIMAVPFDQVEKCRDAGLEAKSILPSFEELGKATALATGLSEDEIFRKIVTNAHFLINQIYLPTLRQSTDSLLDIASEAKLIVGGTTALAAPIVAEARGIPFVSATLQPMAWFSLLEPPIGPGFGALVKAPLGAVGRTWNRLVGALIAAELKRRYARRIDTVRLSLGLPKSTATPVLQPGIRPACSLGFYSPLLGALPPDAPRPAALTGFPWFDSIDGKASALPPELSSFLQDGPPPLVVTLGSFVPFAAREFYRRAAEVALALNMRAVLLSQVDLGISAPSIKVVDYAPHSLLFPHAAAIIHHGGVGTSGQALRSGKPQLVVPFMADQFDNAKRLERLGVGMSAPHKRFMKSGATLLRELLTASSYSEKADLVARSIREENGAQAAADRILEIVCPIGSGA